MRSLSILVKRSRLRRLSVEKRKNIQDKKNKKKRE